MIGSGSAIGTWAMSMINPSVSKILTSSTALITSVGLIITDE